jgi:aldehyde:ferredoxin oxidoreductase
MFNLREGMNPLDLHMNPRAIGEPPQKEGPNAGVTIDARALTEDYLRAMEWDTRTTRPSDSKLQKLGLLELVGPG